MSGTIICPSCAAEIEISEVMSSQLRDEIRRELEKEVGAKRQQLNERERALEAEKQGWDLKKAHELDAERAKLMAGAKLKAEEAVAVELRDRAEREAELRAELKKTQENELVLRKRERALEEEQQSWDLKKARELDSERTKIREDVRKQADQESRLKIKEKDHQIDGMRKQIDELKRRAEQGSQQVQGEVQELALEEMLVQRFPSDGIGEIGKGVAGADVHQSVRTPSGLDAGSILWESKRTKSWNKDWLPKLRNDQREAKADVAVIISATLPEGVDTFAQIDGVWVCGWPGALALATALRAGLIETAKVRRALVGQQGKMETVYKYLASPEFRNRITGIVEAFATMQQDLQKEKRVIQNQWAKREKQIEQAIANTAGMYGDLQGIIGGSLPEIEGIDLLLLESHP